MGTPFESVLVKGPGDEGEKRRILGRQGGGKGAKGNGSQPNGNHFDDGSWKGGGQLGAEKVDLGVMNQREVRGERAKDSLAREVCIGSTDFRSHQILVEIGVHQRQFLQSFS